MILASVFRNATGYLDRYQDQIEKLRVHGPVHVVAVEGDSDDDTWRRLQSLDFYSLKAEHGGPNYGSIDLQARWRQLAAVCNVAMCAATRFCQPDEPFVYIEADLMWEPETILTLVDDLTRVPAVAPMSMIHDQETGTERFYDTYGHTKDGELFELYPPYCDGWDPDSLIPIDTAGSCFVTLGSYLPYLHFSPTECIRGIGQSLRQNGWQLYLDPTVKVVHPS